METSERASLAAPSDWVCAVAWLNTLAGGLMLWWFGASVWSVPNEKPVITEWIDVLAYVLHVLTGACMFVAGQCLLNRRPRAWRYAFISLRGALYSLILMIECVLYCTARADGGILGFLYLVGLLFLAGLLGLPILSLWYVLLPSVREAFGLPPQAHRSWWRWRL
jgi:hypothetical protein